MLYNLFQNQDFQNWLDAIGLGPLVTLMFQLEFRAFFAVVMSFAFVLAFGRPVIRWLVKLKVGDAPEFYNKSLNELMAGKRNTPTMGGLLIIGSILVTVLLLADMRHFHVLLGIVVILWMAMIGAVDDWLKLTSARRSTGSREGLYAWEKLLFQLGIAILAAVFLYLREGPPEARVLTLPFQRTYVPGLDTLTLETGVIILGFPMFVLIVTLLIAGTSNAVNLTDGMDGLATGVTIIACFTMMALCYIAGSSDAAGRLLVPHIREGREMMVLTGAAAGACLGFLWFNCSPAMVFMGDTGSLSLGGLLAYIAVVIRQEVLLLIIGGVFFMEMASVILQVGYFKTTGGKRIFRVSPIHHHFHLGGWSEQQVVIRFWVLGVIFSMIALVSIKLR